jgi:bifunctional DNase/RNase
MDREQTELRIAGVSLDARTQEPQIMLRDTENGSLVPLPAGPYEAKAVLSELNQWSAGEPAAYDSFVELMRLQELYALSVELARTGTARCRLHYTDGEQERAIDMRACDGIALATRLEIPIYSERARAAAESTAVATAHGSHASSAADATQSVESAAVRADRL